MFDFYFHSSAASVVLSNWRSRKRTKAKGTGTKTEEKRSFRFQINDLELEEKKTNLPRKPGCCLTARFLFLDDDQEEAASLIDEDDEQIATCIASKEDREGARLSLKMKRIGK